MIEPRQMLAFNQTAEVLFAKRFRLTLDAITEGRQVSAQVRSDAVDERGLYQPLRRTRLPGFLPA